MQERKIQISSHNIIYLALNIMSILFSKTEDKVIKELSECLIHFDNLANLKMTAFDADASKVAENIIKGIIQSNGFHLASLEPV